MIINGGHASGLMLDGSSPKSSSNNLLQNSRINKSQKNLNAQASNKSIESSMIALSVSLSSYLTQNNKSQSTILPPPPLHEQPNDHSNLYHVRQISDPSAGGNAFDLKSLSKYNGEIQAKVISSKKRRSTTANNEETKHKHKRTQSTNMDDQTPVAGNHNFLCSDSSQILVVEEFKSSFLPTNLLLHQQITPKSGNNNVSIFEEPRYLAVQPQVRDNLVKQTKRKKKKPVERQEPIQDENYDSLGIGGHLRTHRPAKLHFNFESSHQEQDQYQSKSHRPQQPQHIQRTYIGDFTNRQPVSKKAGSKAADKKTVLFDNTNNSNMPQTIFDFNQQYYQNFAHSHSPPKTASPIKKTKKAKKQSPGAKKSKKQTAQSCDPQ